LGDFSGSENHVVLFLVDGCEQQIAKSNRRGSSASRYDRDGVS
jgi:hypothetical protein